MNIITYVKTGCPWCIGVTEFLKEKGLTFETKNVTESKEFFDEMVAISGQTKAPVVIIDGHIIADTDREAVAVFLKESKGI